MSFTFLLNKILFSFFPFKRMSTLELKSFYSDYLFVEKLMLKNKQVIFKYFKVFCEKKNLYLPIKFF